MGEVPEPEARRLLDRQRHVDSSAVAYPNDRPLAFVSGRRAIVPDVDGDTFLDFFGGIGVLIEEQATVGLDVIADVIFEHAGLG